ncbi:hypothetical protein [Dactylosporangium salmoneum]|uniref:Uncharacterized protein n=1 Tax=Dactylosporangium salmoneum TaxID=53361 RepID=A0ABN3H0Y0_9ACTN
MITFEGLFAEVMRGAPRFGHREHVHLTWLAIGRVGLEAAIPLVSEGIQRTARYAGVPQKYHVTMSRAWVELIAAHPSEPDIDVFLARNPDLLDKRLLLRFYRSSTLASDAARTGWVEPDLRPFRSAAHPPA